ncbi:hypothetical protein F5B22DRAFT_652833 [Xylaria bambusicola]|uniref:uncharacterized protein n=1 Tax=Xylaria bambusicola TaxID=326684 RepID=UPI00200806F0|nr:uncharacterized protein F5B22DRAFT_652833 [Xylaria bambusicola]KAI0502725.1 hypothetical protein F5B22DRAFT_652833 [Xylaria bambusicola]
MEVVGTVAATAQLVGIAIGLLNSIAQIHDLIKHVPDRYQRWHVELDLLGEAITWIQQNYALQTWQVRRVLESMRSKMQSLLKLCQTYAPPSKASWIIKIFKNLSAHAIEPRIIEHLQSLEHDKTTLLLAIQLPIPNSDENCLINNKMPKPNFMRVTHHTFTNDGLRVAAGGSQQALTEIVPRPDLDLSRSIRCVGHTGTTQHSRDNGNKMKFPQNYRFIALGETTFQGTLDPELNDAPYYKTMPRTEYANTFKKIRIKGDRDFVGNAMGIGGTFEDIIVEGHDNAVGLCSQPMMKRPSSPPHHQAKYPNSHARQGKGHDGHNSGVIGENYSRHGVYSGGQEATNEDFDDMVIDEQNAEENDHDRMDLDPR